MSSALDHTVTCQDYNEFCGDVRIDRPDTLRKVIDAITPALERGRLEIESGNLDWCDFIECNLHCPTCGQKFELRCETYHGSGGRWSAV